MGRHAGIISFGFLLLISACAPTRFARPLEKKQQALSLSFGGPAILYSGAPIPVPFTTVSYARGLHNRITGFGALHFTSSLFGNIQGDAGAVFGLFELKSGLGMSCSPALQVAFSPGNKNSFGIWPTVDANLYYHASGKRSYLYAGFNAWLEVSKYKAHGELQSRHMIPNLQTGYVIVSGKWQHQIELKYLGLGIPNLPGVVDYVGIGGKGSLGFYYQLTRFF